MSKKRAGKRPGLDAEKLIAGVRAGSCTSGSFYSENDSVRKNGEVATRPGRLACFVYPCLLYLFFTISPLKSRIFSYI